VNRVLKRHLELGRFVTDAAAIPIWKQRTAPSPEWSQPES